MKFGIIADIHGNFQALQAIIEALREQDVNQYIIAGDLIADCAQPNEVVEFIRELDAYVIKGNREEYIQAYIEGKHPEWDDYKQMASVVWTAKALTSKNYEYLNELPNQLQIELNDLGRITMVHGSPFHTSQHLFGDKEHELLERSVRCVESEVLIVGHSHIPWKKYVESTLVFNPGSAGVHFNGVHEAEYGILTYHDNKWKGKHYTVPYDLDEVANQMVQNGLSDAANTWSRLIIQSLNEGINANILFMEKGREYRDCNGFIPNERFDELSHVWFE
ncbi:MAG: metallophosphoesterase family protein [Turicibacter sp.]